MKERLYHVLSIRNGVKTYMTRTPCSHKEACTIMSKITPYKWRTLMLEEVSG